MPPALIVKIEPPVVGRIDVGLAEQVDGRLVIPGMQLILTLLLYPLSANAVPLKVAVCDAKTVNGLFAMVI